MKLYILILIVNLFCITFCIGQEDIKLKGVVVEQNSKFNTGNIVFLSNTQIKSFGSTPKFSDKFGEFTLIFTDNPIGNNVRVFAAKNGYDVVNSQEMKSAAIIGRKAPLKIIMCKAGSLYDNQIKYYKIAKDVALKKYEDRIKILEKEGNKSKRLISELSIEFNQKINTVKEANSILFEQLKKSEKLAKNLADNFLTVNLDDQSEIYQRAFKEFLNKNIDKAISILNDTNLENRLEINSAEKLTEEKIIKNFEGNILNRKKQIRKDIDQCVFKARLHILKNEFTKAENLYEIALKYDKNNDNLIFEYAEFLFDQKKYDEAVQKYQSSFNLYEKLSKVNPEKYDPKKEIVLNSLGLLMRKKNDYKNAILYFEKALKISRYLTDKNFNKYALRLAANLHNLGVVNTEKGDVDEARTKFKESLNYYINTEKKITNKNLNKKVKTLLALSKNYNKINKNYLNEAEEISRFLAKKEPEFYLGDLAFTLLSKGYLYMWKKENGTSKKYFLEALDIYQRLANENPFRYKIDLFKTLTSMGLLSIQMNKLDKALNYFNDSKKILSSLLKKYPDVYLDELARNYKNFAHLYLLQHDLTKAEINFKKSLEILNKISLENPSIYLYDRASIHLYIGYIFFQKGNQISTVEHYEKSKNIFLLLSTKDKSQLFNLAVLYSNLGSVFYEKEPLKSTEYYKKVLDIYFKLSNEIDEKYFLEVFNVGIYLTQLYKKNIETDRIQEKFYKKSAKKMKVKILNNFGNIPDDINILERKNIFLKEINNLLKL